MYLTGLFANTVPQFYVYYSSFAYSFITTNKCQQILRPMDRLHNGQNLYKSRNSTIHSNSESIPKLVEMQSLGEKCCKMCKIWPYKVCKIYIYDLFSITHAIRNTKNIQNLQTSQGYMFRILQHFATIFCNFTNFGMLLHG